MHINLINLTNPSGTTWKEGAVARNPTIGDGLTFEAWLKPGDALKAQQREGSFPTAPKADLGADEDQKTTIAKPKDESLEDVPPGEKDPVATKLAAFSLALDAGPPEPKSHANPRLPVGTPEMTDISGDTHPEQMPQKGKSARVDEDKKTPAPHPAKGASLERAEAPLGVAGHLPGDAGEMRLSQPYQADGLPIAEPELDTQSTELASVPDRALSREALPRESHLPPEVAKSAPPAELRLRDEHRPKDADEPSERPTSPEVSRHAVTFFADPVVNGGPKALSRPEAEGVSPPIGPLQEGRDPASRIIKGPRQLATPAPDSSADRVALPIAATKPDRDDRAIHASEPEVGVTPPLTTQANYAGKPTNPERDAAASEDIPPSKKRGEGSFVAAFQLNALNNSGVSPSVSTPAILPRPEDQNVQKVSGNRPIAGQNMPKLTDVFPVKSLPVDVRQTEIDPPNSASASRDVSVSPFAGPTLLPSGGHPTQGSALDKVELVDPPNRERPKGFASVSASQPNSVAGAHQSALEHTAATRETGPEGAKTLSGMDLGDGARILAIVATGANPSAPTEVAGPAFMSETRSVVKMSKETVTPPKFVAKGLHPLQGDHPIIDSNPVQRVTQTLPEGLNLVIAPGKPASVASQIGDPPGPDAANQEVERSDAPAPKQNELRASQHPLGAMLTPAPLTMTTIRSDRSLQSVNIDTADDVSGFGMATLGLGSQHSTTPQSPHAPAGPHPAVLAQISHSLQILAQQGADNQMNLTLNPEELGRLRFEMTTMGERVHISLFVERGETMDLVRRNVDQLLSDLRQSGFGQASLSFGNWSQRGQTKGERAAPSVGTDMSEAQGMSVAPISTRQIAADGRLDLRL